MADLRRAELRWHFADGTVQKETISHALAGRLVAPLMDAGVPADRVLAVSRSIAERFPRVAEGVWLRALDHDKTDRTVLAPVVLVGEYEARAYGYARRAAAFLDCTAAQLRPVIAELRASGQLGGVIPRKTTLLIRAGAVLADVSLDDTAVRSIARVLAVLGVEAGAKRVRQETDRRTALSELDRVTLVEQSGLEAKMIALLSAGMTAYAIEEAGFPFSAKTIRRYSKRRKTP